jgi:hypothetical protein
MTPATPAYFERARAIAGELKSFATRLEQLYLQQGDSPLFLRLERAYIQRLDEARRAYGAACIERLMDELTPFLPIPHPLPQAFSLPAASAMDKIIDIHLNRFDPVPRSLLEIGASNTGVNGAPVRMATLYHHHYLDKLGPRRPSPDPTTFEYIDQLCDDAPFRMRGSGIGESSAAKRTISNELGQAFCRWFLYEHCRVTFFMHMDKALRSPMGPPAPGARVRGAHRPGRRAGLHVRSARRTCVLGGG